MKAYGTRVFRGLVVVFALFCSSLLHAQSTSQTIQGLVTDQSGAIVPAAAVTITNLATGIETPTSTNETGNYSFQLVLVGNYEVTCKLEGFKTKTVPDLRVATGDQKRADFALELGDISETIEVIASAVGLYTENEIVPNLVEGGRAAVLKPGSLRESSKPFTTKENRREETISHSGFREATASQPQRPHPPAQPKLPTHAALG